MTPLEELIAQLERLRDMTDDKRVLALPRAIDDAKRLIRLERGRSVEAAMAAGTPLLTLARRAHCSRGALDQVLAAWRASQRD